MEHALFAREIAKLLRAGTDVSFAAAAAVAVSSLLPDALCQSPNGFDQLIQLEQSLSGFSLERFATMIDDYFEELSDGKRKRTPLKQRVEESLAAAAS